ncbi:MAG: serine/threonine-protein kinase [Polyangiaceae bacterium]
MQTEGANPELREVADLLGPGARYQPVRLLGRGGMGEVYEARHRSLGSRVVLKIIRADRAQNKQAVERMRREAQALAGLVHPNLVRVTDFDVAPSGQPYFVMEHLEGRSLADELSARKRLPVPEALEIALQVLEGLAKTHEAQVVHRDIKPDNIFLGRDDGGLRVKILDFGIAKFVAGAAEATAGPALTVPGRLVGTPRYVAPEQALLEPLDARVDLYALGLVLYEMVAGEGPFADAVDHIDVIGMHLSRIPRPPSALVPNLPSELDRVIVRCLEKRREDRFGSARELASALQRVARTRARAPAPSAAAPTGEAQAFVLPAPPPALVPPQVAAPSAPTPTPATVPLPPRPNVAPTAPVTAADRAVDGAPQRASAAGVKPPRRIAIPWVIACVVVSGVVASLATHFLVR